jgi:subtilisin family serine protease/subtilisin-like proprotein convertase family protein
VVTVVATDADAGEPNNNGQFTLTRTGPTTSALTVNVAMSGTATNGTDYTAIPTTVTFAAGSATVLVNLTVIDDTLVEGTETATLTVLAGTGYTPGGLGVAPASSQQSEPLPGVQVASVPPGVESSKEQATRPTAPYAPNQLILKFKPGVASDKVTEFQSLFGATKTQQISLTGAQVWTLSGTVSVETILSQYGKNPIFEYIEPDYIVTKSATSQATFPNDPNFSQLWGLHNTGQSGGTVDADIDAPEAWDIQKGNPNLVIGVIDTGVDYNHVDLQGNIWTNPGEIAGDSIDNDGNGYIDDVRGWDFAYNDNNPSDVDGHGTHVAGTIAARGNNGVGVTGVAWNAKVMPLKFLDDTGSGSTSNAILAINYATAKGVKITNNSWGGGGYSQALYDSINAAGQAGSLFVAAAGNSAQNADVSPMYPAAYNLANIISVASTTRTDSLSSFSNYGLTSVDLGAPGSDIYSLAPGGGYATLSGTSMASPHVAGGAALLWSQNPTWTAQQVKTTLMNTGDSIAALAGKTVSGKRLNVYNALGAGSLPTVSVSVSPANVQEDGTTNLVYTFTRTNLNLSSPLTVNFGASGLANAAAVGSDPADYTVLTNANVTFNPTSKLGTVTFAAGATTATVVVDPIADTIAEIANETVILTINSGTGYIGGSPAGAIGTIVSEETLPIFSNPNQITIPDNGSSTTYPSTISVSGLSGTINSLKVTLTGLSHTYSDDIDLLLVGPTGARSLLMSDVGGTDNLNNITLTFDPAATSFLPDDGQLSSGSYKPTNFDTSDLFNAPAPGGPYGADFSVFNNSNPNGIWSLYVMDDAIGDAGIIAGGWSMLIGTGSPSNSATILIADNDLPLPSVTLAANYSGVSENGTTNLIYTFTRTGANTNALTVNYAVTGTAMLGTDYSGIAATPATVTFAANSSTATVTVDPISDTTIEANETVVLTLATGTGYTIGTPGTVTTTILNDDGVINQQGTQGNDVIEVSGITRILSGRAGDDILIGSNSAETFIGGAGADRITTGSGYDIVSYSLASEGADIITDFNLLDDIIQVSASGFGGGLTAGEVIDSSQFLLGTAATTSSHRFIFTQPTGQLFYDIDGNGSTMQTLLATLTPGSALTHQNIFAA